jgi:hypothetical protein
MRPAVDRHDSSDSRGVLDRFKGSFGQTILIRLTLLGPYRARSVEFAAIGVLSPDYPSRLTLPAENRTEESRLRNIPEDIVFYLRAKSLMVHVLHPKPQPVV